MFLLWKLAGWLDEKMTPKPRRSPVERLLHQKRSGHAIGREMDKVTEGNRTGTPKNTEKKGRGKNPSAR